MEEVKQARAHILTFVSLLTENSGWGRPVYEFILSLTTPQILAVIAVIDFHIQSGTMPPVVEAQSIEQVFSLTTIHDLRKNGFLPEPEAEVTNQNTIPFERGFLH